MDYHETVAARRSIRRYEERPLPREHLERILEAARLAPSGTNRQPWRFILLSKKEEIEKVGPAVFQPFVTTAAALFVCCIDRHAFTGAMVKQRMGELVQAGVVTEEAAALYTARPMPETVEAVTTPPLAYLDIGIAVEHMALQAAALGLGSCWVRMFDPARMHELLRLPRHMEVAVLLPVGYPAENPPPRPRLTLEQILLQPGW